MSLRVIANFLWVQDYGDPSRPTSPVDEEMDCAPEKSFVDENAPVPDATVQNGVEEPNDMWLDDWDFTVHRCTNCAAPFRSASRLKLHRASYCKSSAPETLQTPRSMMTHAEVPCTVIDPDGDLIIHAGPTQDDITQRFRVASQVLRVQSRAFSSMFSDSYGFKGSLDLRRAHLVGDLGPAVIYLDDPPEALELVLKALYHRYNELPGSVDFLVLVKVAEVCEKYFLHTALQPTAVVWSKDSMHEVVGSGGWLLITWVFGLDNKFQDAVQSVAQKLLGPSDADRRPVMDTGETMSEAIPEALLGEQPRERDVDYFSGGGAY